MDYCKILNESKNIAVVGISSNESRMSRRIASYLQNAGFNVVGVNPGKPQIAGLDVYASLLDIPFKIDIIDVFRKAEDIPQLIPDILKVSPKYLWLQLGIRNDTAVQPVIEEGIEVVQDYCIKVAHMGC